MHQGSGVHSLASSTMHELTRLNQARLHPSHEGSDCDWLEAVTLEIRRRILESVFLRRAQAEVTARARAAPRDVRGFLGWFEQLRDTGPGQHDPLFLWLETDANLDQFKWFLQQEVAGEAGFEDLVALTQLKMPVRAKLELARNYWDEMGRGTEGGMHGPMLERIVHELDLTRDFDPVGEALALGNLLTGLAFNRNFAYHAIGALGVIELTAPERARRVNLGLKRLGVLPEARQYYALHATLDVKHSAAWNAEVIEPLITERPECRIAIAEGALMRLEAGRRCFERYRHELHVVIQ